MDHVWFKRAPESSGHRFERHHRALASFVSFLVLDVPFQSGEDTILFDTLDTNAFDNPGKTVRSATSSSIFWCFCQVHKESVNELLNWRCHLVDKRGKAIRNCDLNLFCWCLQSLDKSLDQCGHP